MTFLHPGLLALSTGAVAPWVVHLLNRGRVRSVSWGAMMFLREETFAGGEHRARLHGLGLLCLRSALIVALALAVSRPVIDGARLPSLAAGLPTAGLRVGGPGSAVILVDTSAALSYTVNNRSRFDAAKQTALDLAARFDPQTRLGLMTTSPNFKPIQPTAGSGAVMSAMTELQPTGPEADFAVALRSAAKLLESCPPSDGRKIILICDRHAAGWKYVTGGFLADWKTDHLPAVAVVPVGGEEADNLAVESVRLVDPPAIRDVAASFEAVISNTGPADSPPTPVSIFVNARSAGESIVVVPARSRRSVRFQVRMIEPGSKVVAVAIRTAGLTVDNRADTAVDVSDALRVTHVVGIGKPGGAMSIALAPFARPGRRGGGEAVVNDVSEATWPATGTAGADVIIVDGDADFSPTHSAEIEQNTIDGGGLLLLPRETDPPFDPRLWQLVSPVPAGSRIDHTTRLGSIDRQNRVWSFVALGRLPNWDFPWRVRFPDLPGTRQPLAKFIGGDPAMVRMNAGRGRVVVIAGPVTSFERTADFLPWAQSVARFLAGGKVVDRNISIGHGIEERVFATVDDRSATVQLPSSNRREPATVTHSGDLSIIRFAQTAQAGTYRLRYRSGGTETVENYVASAASPGFDLTPMTADDWGRLRTGGFRVMDGPDADLSGAAAMPGERKEIWIELLAAAAALLLVETVVSRR